MYEERAKWVELFLWAGHRGGVVGGWVTSSQTELLIALPLATCGHVDMVAHSCNPSYAGQSLQKCETPSKNKLKQKGLGGVIEMVQHHLARMRS
jgi:hypothetical protein